MISRIAKLQLLVFLAITLIGVSYVGATYAQIDKLIADPRYLVTVDLAESGGIFAGAEVTYRGISVGRVDRLRLNEDGVLVELRIEQEYDEIPADTTATVVNRSAIGEQFVNLEPRSDDEPFLEDGSEIVRADTATPLPVEDLLTDVDNLVASVDLENLQTVIEEAGIAFNGTGEDLGQIIDTTNSFIELADENFEVTVALIRDTNVVLGTQLDLESPIRSFSSDLALLSDTLVDLDPDIRRLLDVGPPAAEQVIGLIRDNEANLPILLNNLITLSEMSGEYLTNIQALLVLYPVLTDGGFAAVSQDANGLYQANFGLVLQQNPPVCTQGYNTERRDPSDLSPLPLPTTGCTAPIESGISVRGSQNAPSPSGAGRPLPTDLGSIMMSSAQGSGS